MARRRRTATCNGSCSVASTRGTRRGRRPSAGTARMWRVRCRTHSRPRVMEAPVLSAPGTQGWRSGRDASGEAEGSEKVMVDTTGGMPSVEVMLASDVMRRATYRSTSETEALVFGYAIADTDGTHGAVQVMPDSLERAGSHRGRVDGARRGARSSGGEPHGAAAAAIAGADGALREGAGAASGCGRPLQLRGALRRARGVGLSLDGGAAVPGEVGDGGAAPGGGEQPCVGGARGAVGGGGRGGGAGADGGLRRGACGVHGRR